jgi:hypothetical protein
MDMHSAVSAAVEGLLGVRELSSDTTAERGLTAIANQTDARPQRSPRRGDACSGPLRKPRRANPAEQKWRGTLGAWGRRGEVAVVRPAKQGPCGPCSR